MSAIEIQHDEAARRFFTVIDDHTARLEYERVGPDTLDYYSTYVPPELRGRGIASSLARHALVYAAEQGQRVIPSCWFVRNLMDREPEFAPLKADS